MMGMSANAPRCPQAVAIYAPNPLACKANTATLDAVLILARKAVFDIALDPLEDRLATNSARWNDNSTDVDAYRAL